MTSVISGKNMDIGESLRQYAIDRIEEAVTKYFNGGFTSQVTFEKEGSGYRADCSIHLDTGINLQTTGIAQDVYPCFDQAAEKLAKRLRRYKRKLKDHRLASDVDGISASSYILASPENDDELAEDFHPAIIAENNIKASELTVGEAVMQMDLTEEAVVVFRNAAHGRINIVYRRNDGNIGWIDPAELRKTD